MQKVWLVCNAASGSNDERALAALQAAFAPAGLDLARTVQFPREPAPTPAALEAAGVDILAIFAGDGTTHAVLHAVYGWGGAVLVLPGGTMNILSKRLHGEASAVEIVRRLGLHPARRTRPNVIRTRHGDGFSGMLAGPGAAWNQVREAMRATDLVGMVASTKEAIAWSAQGPRVRLAGGEAGREDGYAAITITPEENGLAASGYYADTLLDYAGQGIALLSRDFREGPHEALGRFPELRLESCDGKPIELLIDGEPILGEVSETIELTACEVDLLATCEQEQETA